VVPGGSIKHPWYFNIGIEQVPMESTNSRVLENGAGRKGNREEGEAHKVGVHIAEYGLHMLWSFLARKGSGTELGKGCVKKKAE
jgi:hypothetical protein